MSLRLRHALIGLASALTAATAAGADMTLFEFPDFGGRRIVVHGVVANFDQTSFNDRAASIVINSGYWEVCTDAYFRGRCVRLGPGEYRQLGQILSANISSVREVADTNAAADSARIELWEHREFGGRSITLTSNTPNFDPIGFNDRADAAVVYSGVWRLCSDAELQGNCRDLPPGRYNDLGGLGGKVSSAAIISGGGAYAPSPPRPAPPPPPPQRPSAPPVYQSRAILFEQPGFGGRSMIIDSQVLSDFDHTDFNDRAASLRVEGGYWMFCTDARFQGTCRTFGPGEYPQLPWDINDKISSGRRISNDYPYNQPPNWGH